jgi:NADPH-dependent ferric siderophore reductase
MRTLDMRVFRAVVVRVEDVTPSLRRVVLGGPGLADFESTGVGDEYLRILFPAEGQTEPELPRIVDGNLDWGSIDLDRLRTYTVRHHDPTAGEVTIDFVVHEGGVASTWARTAQPGDVVVVNSPTGMYEPASDLDWQVLVADCSSLPALARLVEQARVRGVRTRAVVEVPGPGHEIDLPGCEVTWVHGGNGHGPSRLPEVVRSLTRPSGAGHVWVAGESKALRAVRRHLRHDLGLPASAYRSVGYWIEDAELWRSRYDALDDGTRGALEALWLSDRDEEDIEDEYDERLTALGL